ncbi:SEC-C domain-containing protein [Micromonospora sp. WMMD1082]|uniref:SEC-C domain-containing protein n=1 Tax=Micromonospora sp. WMMD1082 TaxID=3016104 RepID=UPI002416D14D|nr:SEC-C domain-containing protein [Micromonospora sp. WMMD1082]MDG4794522.1 SEC-C domain-containing protein [Micromonospora sp. WMMD1082]
MPTKNLLTSADLDDVRGSALGAANPLGVAAELADAVERGRLADPQDAGRALALAAEIAEVRSRLDAALRYADQAVAAYAVGDDARAGFARALRARILFRLGGREDEAMAELTELRPLLVEQPDAPAYLSAALDAGSRSSVADEWLTEAVDTLLGQRTTAGAPEEGGSVAERAAEVGPPEAPGVLFFLLQQRHRVRRDLNLPHDRHDDLADRLEAQLLRRAEQRSTDAPDLLFFPEDEFGRLRAEQTALTEAYGSDWDGHRARLEKEMVRLAGTGRSGLHVLRASVDGLTGYAGRQGGEVTDPQLRAGYAREIEARPGALVPWPPERNDACWCGSGLKYKKCCLPRSRS